MNKKSLFRYLFLILLLSTLIFLAGCSNNKTDLPKMLNYNVIFTVLDESNLPVMGTEITLSETTKTTDNQCKANFSKETVHIITVLKEMDTYKKMAQRLSIMTHLQVVWSVTFILQM